MSDLVPLYIRPHLVPFLFKEFEGTEVNYIGKNVKACKISSKSSLGFLIKTSLQKADKPLKKTNYYIHILLDNDDPTAKMYTNVNGKNNFLYVPEFQEKKINEFLEDMFRIAFVYMTKGMLRNNKELKVREALSEFMTEYELDEFGFTLESLRRLLDRNSKYKLSRLQNQVSNRYLNSQTMS